MITKIQNLVTEAVSLDREISEQTERLKALKAQLVEAAREQEDELTPTDGGGLRWTAEGQDGCVARVNFPAPSLKSKIEGEGNHQYNDTIYPPWANSMRFESMHVQRSARCPASGDRIYILRILSAGVPD